MSKAGVDPKVFFSNERTYLQWLNTSVTIGSIGSGLLGVAGVASADTHSFSPVRIMGLLLIGLSILFCFNAMYQYNKRMKLLRLRLGYGYDDSAAPIALSVILIVTLGTIYITYII